MGGNHLVMGIVPLLETVEQDILTVQTKQIRTFHHFIVLCRRQHVGVTPVYAIFRAAQGDCALPILPLRADYHEITVFRSLENFRITEVLRETRRSFHDDPFLPEMLPV